MAGYRLELARFAMERTQRLQLLCPTALPTFVLPKVGKHGLATAADGTNVLRLVQ
jgi:hypothetical protein